MILIREGLLKAPKKENFEANMTITTLEYKVVRPNSTPDRVDSVYLVFSSSLECLDFHCILQSNLVKVDCLTFSPFYASVVEMLT